MNDEKIKKFPITRKVRMLNSHGIGYVPCEISERWLMFDKTYDKPSGFVFVNVMTKGSDGEDKKLCSLCLNIHDLKDELGKITPL